MGREFLVIKVLQVSVVVWFSTMDLFTWACLLIHFKLCDVTLENWFLQILSYSHFKKNNEINLKRTEKGKQTGPKKWSIFLLVYMYVYMYMCSISKEYIGGHFILCLIGF